MPKMSSIYSAVSTQYRRVTADRQTDRHRAIAYSALCMCVGYASRGNEYICLLPCFYELVDAASLVYFDVCVSRRRFLLRLSSCVRLRLNDRCSYTAIASSKHDRRQPAA